MGKVVEFRNGKRTEHHEDSEYLSDAWDWAQQINRLYWEAAQIPFDLMEALMFMRDQSKKPEVIEAAHRFRPMATERRIETRRHSGTRVPVAKRRHDDDDLPPAA